MGDRIVTVFRRNRLFSAAVSFGSLGTGFCVRIAPRRADGSHTLFDYLQLRWIKTDVHDEWSVADALADAYGAVNGVSLHVEQGRETFHWLATPSP
jgi:hypothetical protein